MAANPKPPVAEGPGLAQYHVYHAEAHVLSGNLKHPLDQPIEQYARVVLRNRRADHVTEMVEATSIEGLVSFQAGYTRASGSKIQKRDLWGNDHSGWVTLSSSVTEGLNVFDVITADRVVSQVSTEHAMENGHVPKVTFLGTRFDNLRIGGYPVPVELNLTFCGDKPEGDKSYLEDSGFLGRVQKQLRGITGTEGLPGLLKKQADANLAYIDDLKKGGNGRGNEDNKRYPKLGCSLVKSIGPIPLPGVKIFGNMIYIPDFGIVSLAELEVGCKGAGNGSSSAFSTSGSAGSKVSNYFTLTMLNMQLGCIGGGDVQVGAATANGHTAP